MCKPKCVNPQTNVAWIVYNSYPEVRYTLLKESHTSKCFAINTCTLCNKQIFVIFYFRNESDYENNRYKNFCVQTFPGLRYVLPYNSFIQNESSTAYLLILNGPAPVSTFQTVLQNLTYHYLDLSSILLDQPNMTSRQDVAKDIAWHH